MRLRYPGCRRDIAGTHREHGLDQARRAGCGLRVPDVGLDRPERRDAARVGAQLGERVQFGAVGRRGPSAVSLDQLDVAGGDPGSPVRPAQREELAARVGHGRADLRGRRRAPARDLGVDRKPGRAGVGRPHQHEHTAALSGQETGRILVVDTYVIAGKGTGLGQPDQLQRVEAEVHTAREGDIEVAIGQRGAGGSHGEQCGGLRAVHRVTAAPEPEEAADPGRDDGRCAASEGLVGHGGERRLVALRRVLQHRDGALPRDVTRRERIGEHLPYIWPAQPQRGSA